MKVLVSRANQLGTGLKVLGVGPKDLAGRINVLGKEPEVLIKCLINCVGVGSLGVRSAKWGDFAQWGPL